MRQEGEPSVEEILESIKKVIARDNRESATAERQRRESAGMRTDEPEEDDDGSVLELGDAGEVIEEGEALPGTPAMLSEEAERTMRETLAELAVLAESGRGAQPCSGGTSVEAMVRDMLKPMLAQWLDRHMPAIVERLVKAEIARLKG